MVQLIVDRLLAGSVCTDINPNRPDAFDELDRQLSELDNGTHSHPWRAVRPNDERYGQMGAVCDCEKYRGERWHYAVVC